MRPTFDGWKDRLTFLSTNSQLVSVVLLLVALGGVAGTIWLFTSGGWDVPPWGWSLLGGTLVLTPITVPSAYAIARWLRRRNQVVVYLCNAESHAANEGKAQEKFYVPPDIWAEKSIGRWAPTPLNGGAAWQVREFDWNDDLGELYVEGTPMPELNDDRMFTWKTYVEDIYGDLIDRSHALNRARDRMSKMAVDVEEASTNEAAEARERGQMLDKTAAKDAWEDATGDLNQLAATDDLPDIDDYMNYDETDAETEGQPDE
ncbi:hypothetical protein J2752_001965 [Halarchaeum rubridurum]|uniref:Uncharacterized protein n=1 Tax=Halarchaeum rubridurum TaxID=489911 RepID=A0A830G0G0_9EURY|nr:hypothetical protein [Halarchaeum rubridurum]MBP1955053.1 hypothetical protein [Halarchaeum rubridurum]GGM69321.1 hypothetical protein GCM10009017_19400 [Halarchaeum rubridurum]